MQTVDRVLRQSVGEDAVFIHMPNAVGTVLLKPRHTVRCDDMLLGALRDVLGSESVVMERVTKLMLQLRLFNLLTNLLCKRCILLVVKWCESAIDAIGGRHRQ